MAAAAPSFWQGRGWRAVLLLPLSLLFLLLSSLRRLAYRWGVMKTVHIPVPVIIVGNIAVGGSGKTPVVAWLAQRLRMHGFTPGVVSRGYGRSGETPQVVSLGDSATEVGDEPLLLARLTGGPVVVGRDRPAAIAHLLTRQPDVDVILSDDGLQHLALGRDLEVLVVDEQVLGNRWQLPAGPLREPVSRLRDADLVLLHGPVSDGLRQTLGAVRTAPMRLVGDHFESLCDPARQRPPEAFMGLRVHAVAGIGRPERFFDQLRAMGLDVVPHPFPDHHPFTADDLAFPAGEPILLTGKDAVKCAPFAPADTWVFPVVADIPEAAVQPVLEKLNRHGRQAA